MPGNPIFRFHPESFGMTQAQKKSPVPVQMMSSAEKRCHIIGQLLIGKYHPEGYVPVKSEPLKRDLQETTNILHQIQGVVAFRLHPDYAYALVAAGREQHALQPSGLKMCSAPFGIIVMILNPCVDLLMI